MKRGFLKIALCCLFCFLILTQAFVFSFAQDTYLNRETLNYSTSIARTDAQCSNVYRYLSSVMNPEYVPRIYDLIYRAQYRITLNGGSSWPYWNEGDSVSQIDDNVIGTQYIYPAKGCNAYARFGAQYTRRSQGTLVRAADYFGKPQTFVPNADQIHTFVARYADVGERILTGYYNATAKEIRPHSFLFLAQDPQEDGFYFLCQDGDGNGQTLRYITYAYLATLLRYFENYGYSLAIGDTNNGLDSFSKEDLYGKVDQRTPQTLYFSEETGMYATFGGWVVSQPMQKVQINAYLDDEPIGICSQRARSDIEQYYPGRQCMGFEIGMDYSAWPSGTHTLTIVASSGSRTRTLHTETIEINNLTFGSDKPLESTVRLPSNDPLMQTTGWAYDRTGAPVTFAYSIDNDTHRPLTNQSRTDVQETHSDCMFSDVGYDLTVEFPTNVTGSYRIDLYACVGKSEFLLRSLVVYITASTPHDQKYPVSIRLQTLPKTTLAYGEDLQTDQISLLVTYSDGTKEIVDQGFVCSNIRTNIPGKQTVIVQYEGLSCSFDVEILPHNLPQQVQLRLPQILLQRGKTMATEALIDPADADSYTIRRTSQNPSVATIDDDGVITGVSYGTSEITISLLDPMGNVLCSDSAQVRVCSAFRIWLNQLWNRLRSMFGIRIHAN